MMGWQLPMKQKIIVENPATNEVLETVKNCDSQDVAGEVNHAVEAFRSWSAIPLIQRRSALRTIANILDERTDELARILVLEIGKPLVEARHEVRSAATVFRTFSDFSIDDAIIRDTEDSLLQEIRRPLGVAALIIPWNYPLLVLSWKLAPALLAGNTVVIKPSPYAPLNTMRFSELVKSVIPPGVINIVTGDDATGRSIVGSKEIAKIAFTGHVDTGRKILQESGSGLKWISLELGGNDPAIVLPDFDMKRLPSLFWSSFRNAGQICIAVKRLYVHDSIFESVVEKYERMAREVRLGNGMDEETQMGPVNNPRQLRVVKELIRDAREGGGGVRTGGRKRNGPGYFYPPTVVTDVDENCRLVSEEQFGPVIPIMPYSHIDEAIDRANSLRYGLGASVWTSNVTEGRKVAEQIQSGTVWVNTHMIVDPLASFGGVKDSGLGKELGIRGYDEYCSVRTININRK